MESWGAEKRGSVLGKKDPRERKRREEKKFKKCKWKKSRGNIFGENQIEIQNDLEKNDKIKNLRTLGPRVVSCRGMLRDTCDIL